MQEVVTSIFVLERMFKGAIFLPVIALIAWWLLTNWLNRTLPLRETLLGLALLTLAALLGTVFILRGGWGFLGVLAFSYLALLAATIWYYIEWRRRERERLLNQIQKYKEAIERDPTNAAAYSFLGESHLKLSSFEEAAAALQKAIELDPKSTRDLKLLKQARQHRPTAKWLRLN